MRVNNLSAALLCEQFAAAAKLAFSKERERERALKS